MNLASIVVLLVILVGVAFALRRTLKSKGACEDCTCHCPVNEKHDIIK